MYKVLPEDVVDTITDQQALSAFKAILRAFSLWDVSDADAEVLLNCSSSDYALILDQKMSLCDRKDIILRLSYFLGIFADLHIQFGRPICYQWIKLPNSNSVFGGASPLEFIKSNGIEGLVITRNYVSDMAEYVGFG